ncbi:hypothetical protein LTR56_014279 [Elasticomyces elasticus]|nr:hypothetical protein LTR56_014279 [Elasticomyces elasticus]KAK4930515.1 hypothetical protein LTR49_002927 [Elasticomyces elasticus]KAK5750448.1 hypothetical protein LTS12_019478 [Elasticomyces elasticus]
MAYPGQTDEDFAEMQKLSNEYEPEITGPLVSERQPSSNIASEYASADPVYQAKTSALPQKYSHYRMVRGDGKCGWRAIGFGYFEALIHFGDSNKFLEEETRLRSMSNVLNAAGFATYTYEDFADEAFELLRKLGTAMHSGNASEVLQETFNDDMLQNYVITYLRILTAAWMKAHQPEYAPWLLGQTIDHYCDVSVMPTNSEIENVSLSALKDVLLSPSGIALEILYLDRTEGGEVNMHRFDPVSFHGGFTIGTIRLLYRPGHYDILYKMEDLPPPPPPPMPEQATIPTYLQFGSSTHNEHVFDIAGMDFMTQIPGMSCINPHQAWMSPSYGNGASDFFATTAPAQQCAQPIAAPAPTPTPAPQPQQIQPQSMYAVPATPTHYVAPPNELSQELAIRTISHAPLANASLQQHVAGPFRPSQYQLDVRACAHMPFQTTIFKNSHYNTAHFMNEHFQPEEWRPDDEYVTITSSSKPTTRHKNCV